MKKTILIILLSASIKNASAQTEKQLLPSDLKQQTIVTEPVTLRKGFFRAGFQFDYRVADKYFNNKGQKEYFLSTTWGAMSAYEVALQYGLSDRFQIDLISEYMNKLTEINRTEINTADNASSSISAQQKGIGLGDSKIVIGYQILPEKERKISILGGLRLTIPTGQKNPANIKNENQYDLPVGDGTYALGLSLSTRKLVYPYSLSGFIAYTTNFNGTKLIRPADLEESQFRLGNIFESGFSLNLHLNEWIVLANEINYTIRGQAKIENVLSNLMPASRSLSYEPSLIFQLHRFRLGEFVRIPIRGKNVPADPLFILMAQYIF